MSVFADLMIVTLPQTAPPPDPPRHPVEPAPRVVERGQSVVFDGRAWRVDNHLLPHAVCTLCGVVHAVDYVLGSPDRDLQLGRVAGCLVGEPS